MTDKTLAEQLSVYGSATLSAEAGVQALAEVDYFARRRLLAGEPPPSTIEDAITAQQLVEAAEESIRVVRFG